MAVIRSIPTVIVTGFWEEGSVSEEPEHIKIVFSNGKKVLYDIAVKQPKPNTMTPSEMARIFTEHVFGGYRNKNGR